MAGYSNTKAQTATGSAFGLHRPSGPVLLALYPQQQGILLPYSYACAYNIQEWRPCYFNAYGTYLSGKEVGSALGIRNPDTH